MSNDFAQVKEQLDLLSVITQETGFAKRGPHLEQCPFCDGHGCFSVRDKNFHCFQCDERGDIFAFLETYHKLDKLGALKLAAKFAGITLKKGDKSPKDAAGLNLTTRERIFAAAAHYYHGRLSKNGGMDYFRARGHEADTLKSMLVGFSDGNLVNHLRGQGFADKEIKAASLGKDKKVGDHVHLLDFFGHGLAIFPHWEKNQVLHFTMKDPAKRVTFQLPNTARSKDWRFYNQDALRRFGELILVEGENDLLTILGAGAKNVIAQIGQPADYQIKALKTYCAQKHLYLWLDNDQVGRDYVRKICAAVGQHLNLRVVVYSDKFNDPDEYLRGFSGDLKKEVNRLLAESLDYVAWEIREIAKLDSLEARLKALKSRKIFPAVAGMVAAEKVVYVEKLTRLGFPEIAIEEQLDTDQDLKQELAAYFEQWKKDADPNQVAAIIYKHLGQAGRFFRDREHNVFLLHNHHIYSIGNNRPFNALIKRTTLLLPTREPGRSVWESLASEAYNKGQLIELAAWIASDYNTDSIFINLNSANNVILKVSPAGITEIPNGINEDAVLLKSSDAILPFNFLPDAEIKVGMRLLKELVFDNLTCEVEQRYLILCWLMSAFLLDFSPSMGLMKFSGSSRAGKTTAAKLVSFLIYGDDVLDDPTNAASYSFSAENPLLVLNNFETAKMNIGMLKFLQNSADKTGKRKRMSGSDSKTFKEKASALVLITAIEPLIKPEHINRTYDIEFDNKFKSDDFVEGEIIRQLVKGRDIIVSAMLKFIQADVLPNLAARRDFITILRKEHKGHAKDRTDEYLALLMLMCEKLLKYIPLSGPDEFPFGDNADEVVIRRAWVNYQNDKARETETQSNSILKLFDGLVREYLPRLSEAASGFDAEWGEVFQYTHPDYLLELIKTRAEVIEDERDGEYTRAYVEFVATSGEIVSALDRYCRNSGIRNPYETASVFVSRLRNDLPLLKKGGWETVSRPGLEPYYRRIKGTRLWKFRKTLIK